MTLSIRPAGPGDAARMAELLNEIIEIGGTTAHRRPFDAVRMQSHYVAPPENIACTVAAEGGEVLGFQSLVWPKSAPGHDEMPEGWAIIATFVRVGQHGRGVGRRLFAATLGAARAAGVVTIDAAISTRNSGGLAFYSGLGFVDYRRRAGLTDSQGDPLEQICKRYDLA